MPVQVISSVLFVLFFSLIQLNAMQLDDTLSKTTMNNNRQESRTQHEVAPLVNRHDLFLNLIYCSQ